MGKKKKDLHQNSGLISKNSSYFLSKDNILQRKLVTTQMSLNSFSLTEHDIKVLFSDSW